MKKTLFLIGASVTTIAPITLVSCTKKPSAETTPIPWTNLTPSTDKNKEFKDVLASSQITDDGIYFWQKTYLDGKLWNKETIDNGAPLSDAEVAKLVPMVASSNTFSYDQVVELGDNDKFYVVFDNDDADGFSVQDFEKEFYFEDSSFSNEQTLEDLDTQLGNQIVPAAGWKELMVGVKNGQSNAYFGSQSNHMTGTWQDAMDKLKTTVPAEAYQAVDEYYKTHNHAFFPVAINQGMFTYEKIASNAYELTYHYQGSPITQAFFVLKNQKDNKVSKFPALSLGDQTEWTAYSKHPEAKYLALKNVFISKP